MAPVRHDAEEGSCHHFQKSCQVISGCETFPNEESVISHWIEDYNQDVKEILRIAHDPSNDCHPSIKQWRNIDKAAVLCFFAAAFICHMALCALRLAFLHFSLLTLLLIIAARAALVVDSGLRAQQTSTVTFITVLNFCQHIVNCLTKIIINQLFTNLLRYLCRLQNLLTKLWSNIFKSTVNDLIEIR